MRAYLVTYRKGCLTPEVVHCCDCLTKQKRYVRASYRCTECGDCLCRKHALKHFDPAQCPQGHKGSVTS